MKANNKKINKTNMDTKEFKVAIPEGYEIDKENSTFECIKFKLAKKNISYRDVCNVIFSNDTYFINDRGYIFKDALWGNEIIPDKNIAANRKQLEKILALNQLLNIAEYYNRNHNNKNDWPYCISYQVKDGYKVY